MAKGPFLDLLFPGRIRASDRGRIGFDSTLCLPNYDLPLHRFRHNSAFSRLFKRTSCASALQPPNIFPAMPCTAPPLHSAFRPALLSPSQLVLAQRPHSTQHSALLCCPRPRWSSRRDPAPLSIPPCSAVPVPACPRAETPLHSAFRPALLSPSPLVLAQQGADAVPGRWRALWLSAPRPRAHRGRDGRRQDGAGHRARRLLQLRVAAAGGGPGEPAVDVGRGV
eukprot:358702-Chlamydomonas_euryale.AAC.1